MINDRLGQLRDYPFARLNKLLEGTDPPAGREPIVMSIGEPRHPYPPFVNEVLAANAAGWSKYPPTPGTPAFRAAVADWLTRRFALPAGMVDPERHVLPVAGTREALFNIALTVVPKQKAGKQPVVLIPDPFYQVYVGAAVLAGAEPVFVPASAETAFLPDFASVPRDLLERAALAYLCSPSNPQGTIAGLPYLARLIALAREHDFVLAADECYCEIYDSVPPPGVLEACAALGRDMTNVIAFHSLSKRSNVPGLRSGFVAGGADLIADFQRQRSYSGGITPLPVLAVAEALWRDEAHVEENRALYHAKFDIAAELLEGAVEFTRPAGGFYLWLDVGDGEAAAKQLWAEAGVKVMPGAYLSRPREDPPGAAYIRAALVDPPDVTAEALRRLAPILRAERVRPRPAPAPT